ncbi:hypothetical protein IZ6_17290 [Terrihabitans soli]|uniref:Cysteine rich repeat protein n=1 Tax=Terrihabitans soli TaxID=708113 RepID=A0A6S6QKV3_9HYPH|nr:hypothetical protein [Terrihabitans soli]BCJ90994.1 hypothetical protein IZ6_17290 [Terrihabitans soli]
MPKLKTLIAAMLFCAVAAPVMAQTISYGEAIDKLVAACGADVDKYCKDVRLGGNRIQDCLSANAGVSGICKVTLNEVNELLQKRAAAQAAVPQLCKSEAKRLCENFREGRGRILRCLTREENARNVSKECNTAITNAGWR